MPPQRIAAIIISRTEVSVAISQQPKDFARLASDVRDANIWGMRKTLVRGDGLYLVLNGAVDWADVKEQVAEVVRSYMGWDSIEVR